MNSAGLKSGAIHLDGIVRYNIAVAKNSNTNMNAIGMI